MSSPNLKIHNDPLWEQVQTPLTKGLDGEIRRQSRHSTHGHPEGTSQSPGASQEIEGPCQSHELTLPPQPHPGGKGLALQLEGASWAKCAEEEKPRAGVLVEK